MLPANLWASFVFKNLLDEIKRMIGESTSKLLSTLDNFKTEFVWYDTKTAKLETWDVDLETKLDYREQHGWRDSVRIFGLSGSTRGSTNEKVIHLCNKQLDLSPPGELGDISVSHQVGTLGDTVADVTPPPPRALLVKFAYWWIKNQVISACKKLRRTPPAAEAESQADYVSPPPLQQSISIEGTTSGLDDDDDDAENETNDDDDDGYDWRKDGEKISISDDLTMHRAKLA